MPSAKAQPTTIPFFILFSSPDRSAAAATGVLGLLDFFVPLGAGFPAVLAPVGARQLLALLALQLTHLQVHGLRDLAPALVLRALVEHAAQRALQLLGRGIRDA